MLNHVECDPCRVEVGVTHGVDAGAGLGVVEADPDRHIRPRPRRVPSRFTDVQHHTQQSGTGSHDAHHSCGEVGEPTAMLVAAQ